MTMQIIQTGRQPPACVKLTTTDATTIVSGPSAGIDTLESLAYSTSASTTLSIWLTDGSTNWHILNGETVTEGRVISDLPIQLKSGWSIRAEAGDADMVDIIAITARTTQN